MSPRLRLALWALAVAGCGLSPVLFRLIAPWAGALWQCVCLAGILWLYATTPADAIKLPKWVSKAVIIGGMAAWPWLCYGRLTPAMLVTPVVVFLFDHIALTMVWRGERRMPAWTGRRWSWTPGIASDWITVALLWSPAMWYCLCDPRANAVAPPQVGVMSSMFALVWLLASQMPSAETGALESPDRKRIAGASAYAGGCSLLTVVGYAL